MRGNTFGNSNAGALRLASDWNTVVDNTVRSAETTSIVVTGSFNRLNGNRIMDNASTGLEVRGGRHNRVLRNHAEGNHGHGFMVGEDAGRTLLYGNVARGNGTDGFHVRGRSTSLYRNEAVENGAWGIWADAGAKGGGSNVSQRNAAGQCHGLACRESTVSDTAARDLPTVRWPVALASAWLSRPTDTGSAVLCVIVDVARYRGSTSGRSPYGGPTAGRVRTSVVVGPLRWAVRPVQRKAASRGWSVGARVVPGKPLPFAPLQERLPLPVMLGNGGAHVEVDLARNRSSLHWRSAGSSSIPPRLERFPGWAMTHTIACCMLLALSRPPSRSEDDDVG